MTAVVAGQQDQNIHKKYAAALGNYDGRYYHFFNPGFMVEFSKLNLDKVPKVIGAALILIYRIILAFT